MYDDEQDDTVVEYPIDNTTDVAELHVLVWFQQYGRTSKENPNFTVQQLREVIAYNIGMKQLSIDTIVKVACTLGYEISARSVDSDKWYINLPEDAWGKFAHARRMQRFLRYRSKARVHGVMLDTMLGTNPQ